MDERFEELFRRQLASGFEDVRGADASITLPVSERLLNEVIARSIPRSAPVRELQVKPQAGDQFLVRARIGSSPLVPQISLTLSIESTARIPGLACADSQAADERPAVARRPRPAFHERASARHPRRARSGLSGSPHISSNTPSSASYLDYVKELRVKTVDGAVVLSIRAGV